MGPAPALSMPVLLVAGALDAKFVAIAERMAGRFPDATLAIIDGAGHTAHLERPDAFLAVLEAWLGVTTLSSEADRRERAEGQLHPARSRRARRSAPARRRRDRTAVHRRRASGADASASRTHGRHNAATTTST